MAPPAELRALALACLTEADPDAKVAAVTAMAAAWRAGACTLDTGANAAAAASAATSAAAANAAAQSPPAIPGRPARPALVHPRMLGQRSMATLEGRAMLIHALAHIEFNATNLALDALWRFPDMPPEYYADWLRVSAEEATHYAMLAAHLRQLGYAYGDFAAHDSLWEMVHKTRGDVLARMALVPRTLEARGLDAIPPLQAKLGQAGDAAAVAILDIILRDEIGHVEIGNRWYGHLCRQRGLEPYATYAALALQYKAPTPRGPFNLEARRQAGFTDAELAALTAD
ncbi:ferritin-like domain-containing protein [Rugamonas sp.]|uniref:ferritin-like domain-containing protein n=1 Tax=Rugamonas sp. TaxID=1926287 RepID=UPI0025FDA697|nr:ferritin-like domain-containing protein [Rugamonas sp.]